MLKTWCMSKIQKMFRYLSHDLDMTKYISNILYPIWKYTHKGFPPTPSHPTPCWGRPQRGRGGHGVGVGWGGIPYGYISILDIGYWISILSISIYIYINTPTQNPKCQKNDENPKF